MCAGGWASALVRWLPDAVPAWQTLHVLQETAQETHRGVPACVLFGMQAENDMLQVLC